MFIHSSAEALALLPLRAIVNRAAVSTGVQVSVQVPACSSLGYVYLGVELLSKIFIYINIQLKNKRKSFVSPSPISQIGKLRVTV